MKFSSRLLYAGVVVALVAILAGLAILQYRWSGDVSEATTARMQTGLRTSLVQFREDLSRELGRICIAFQPQQQDESTLDAAYYSERLQYWKGSASHPALISNLYLLKTDQEGKTQLFKLKADDQKFETVDWPKKFKYLQSFAARTSEFRIANFGPPFPGRGQPPPRGEEFRGQGQAPFFSNFGETPRPDNRPREAGRGAQNRDDRRTGRFGYGNRFGRPWMIDESAPALVYFVPRSEREGLALSWIIIELNSSVLQQHIFPELAEKYFGNGNGLSYQVAIVGGTDDQPNVLYSSDSKFGAKGNAVSDANLNLLGPPLPGTARGRTDFNFFRLVAPRIEDARPADTRAPDARSADGRPAEGRPAGGRDTTEITDLQYAGIVRLERLIAPDQQDWRILVKHPKGSVEAAVAAIRKRNLAVSFGVLGVLAITMGFVLVISQRAQRLAQLQMDFVTGVSHELRTPLAVISSAAENIEDGVVENKEQLVRYAGVIRKHARQLTELVEQVLQFAATRQYRQSYRLSPLQVPDVIDSALENTASLLKTANITVERQIESNLPPVAADFSALSQCLQNLITNAVKYRGDSNWIGIEASRSNQQAGLGEVKITVRDKGIGIASGELEQIFEPFYRSPAVTASQIHGTGLGLPLAKSIAEAMGGKLTVESEVGKGTSFTLRLQAANQPVPSEQLAIDATVKPRLT